MLIWKIKSYELNSVLMMSLSMLTLMNSINMYSSGYIYMEWEIFSLNGSSFTMSLLFDWMSLMFLSLVSYISSMVLLYSGGYMEGDKNMDRFIYLVMMFVVSMWMLIISPSLVSILIGWDGLGLVSYVLVVYYMHEKSAEAGMLTIMSNRVGDVAILLGITLMSVYGSWNFIFYTSGLMFKQNIILAALVVLAGMTKSAQIPFCSWLPAAMAAPTPVSSLVHSSTLVTAGVYLLIRFSDGLINVSSILFVISSLTMLMSGLVANFENDMKKIIALSTLSQLSVMMMILSIGWMELAFFHLVIHALFKAMLFMCAGSIIHSVGGHQDIRFMGSVSKYMPLSVSCLILANLALCGTPFLAGFYSKDLILEMAFSSELNEVCFWLIVFSTGMTVSYTFRMIYYLVLMNSNMCYTVVMSDESKEMTYSMLGLMIGVIFSGAGFSWLMKPLSSTICLTFEFKTLALLVSFMGAMVGTFSLKSNSLKSFTEITFFFMNKMWLMQKIFNMIPSYIINKSKMAVKVLDFGWGEHYGGQGFYNTFMKWSQMLQSMQNNQIITYMLLFMIVMIFLLMKVMG